MNDAKIVKDTDVVKSVNDAAWRALTIWRSLI
ncbi:hypothetical protein HNR77_000746 [Paenibacillus sp. JGP012]|nr:hypothetical protein [Paenibacillus sp. JGP012]